MTDVVNCALHVSVNSGTDSEVEVTVDRSFNSSIHLRYVLNGFLTASYAQAVQGIAKAVMIVIVIVNAQLFAKNSI